MAVMSYLDDELAAEEKAQRAQQDLALRDRRAGEATLNPAVGAALQGATFGFGDEGTAAIRSLFGSTDYDTALQQERAGMEKYRAENPIKDFALNLGGSVVPALAGGRIIRGLRGEPTLPPPAGTPPVPGPLPTPTSLTQPPPPPPPIAPVPAVPALGGIGPTVANAAKLGALQGGVTGFGEGEGGPMARLASALPSALLGGVVGGAAGGITHGLAEGARYPLDALSRFRGGAGAERGALDKIIQNADRSGGGVDEIATRLRDQNAGRLDLDAQGFPGSGTTLGEIMGPSVTPAMDAASQMPGRGSTQLREQLTARGEGRGERVTQGLRAVFGDLEDDYAQRQRLRTERSADAGPLFQSAWANARPLEPIDMQNLSHVPSEVFSDARKIARMQGENVNFTPRFDEDGFMLPLREGETLPLPEDMHRVKSSLNDYINTHTDPTGQTDALGHHAMTVRDAIRSRLNELTTDDQGVSHYQQATNAWAEPSAEIAASKLGRGAANMNGAELQNRISTMSDPERQAFAAGFFGDLRERLSKVDLTGTANPVRAVFKDEKQRNAVNTALSTLGIGADEADRRMTLLSRFFGDEMAGSRTETSILRGSQTGQRQAWMKDLAIPAVGGTAVGGYSLASGDDPTTAMLKGIGTATAGRLSGLARQGIASRGTENMNNAMLRLLGQTDAGAQQDAIRALQARALAARAGAGGGAGFTGGVGGLAGQQAGPRISGGLGIPAGLAGLLSPPAPLNDPRFQPQ